MDSTLFASVTQMLLSCSIYT